MKDIVKLLFVKYLLSKIYYKIIFNYKMSLNISASHCLK